MCVKMILDTGENPMPELQEHICPRIDFPSFGRLFIGTGVILLCTWQGVMGSIQFQRFSACKTLRVTLAMEAGIADHVWTLEEIVKLIG